MNGVLSSGTNLILFIVMLGLLVFVHEAGHFITAKRLRIPVLEFGFGFPPRVWKFWQGAGWIEIQSRRIAVPRTFKLPANVNVGSRVLYKTEKVKGREVLTALEVVDDDSQGTVLASPVQALDRGTEYTINAIPLGGFVRLLGEEDPNVPGGFARAKPSVRAPVLLAGVTMNLILAYLAFTIAAFASPPYVQVQSTRVTGIAPGSPAALAGLRAGDTITAVDGINVKDNFPALSQLLRDNAGRSVTLTVVRGSNTLPPISVTPRANPPAGEGAVGVALNTYVGLRVTSVAPGSVADRAGLRPGDVLIFVVDPSQGRPLKDQNELAQWVQAHPGWKVEWRVLRGGSSAFPVALQIPNGLDPRTWRLVAQPRSDDPSLNSVVVQIPDPVTPQDATLGLSLQTSLLGAPGEGAAELGRVLGSIPTLVSQLVRGAVPSNAFVGFVGIYQATGEVAQRGGVVALVEFLGLLSLNLAIVNLLPFPALDGGRLVFVVLEWIRGGKKVDPQKEGLVHLVGIAVLLSFMILITFFDVQRLLSGHTILPGP